MPGFFEQGHRAGDPPAEHGNATAKNALTSNLGPLPVWGWALVVIGAIVLYRKMTGASSSSSTTGTNPSVPVGTNFGELYLANSPAAPTAPSTPSTPAPSTPGTIESQWAADQQSIAQQAQAILSSGAGAGQPASQAQFFAANTAMKQMGLPYFSGVNDPTTGQAMVINPATGQSVPLGEITAIPAGVYRDAISLGRTDAWQALTSGQTTWTPPAGVT